MSRSATDSALCYYDRQPEIPGQQFRLIFTPDMQMWPTYKLPASNPGQFYYNVFYVGTPGSTVNLNINIPYPFVTNGANPIQVHDGFSIETL